MFVWPRKEKLTNKRVYFFSQLTAKALVSGPLGYVAIAEPRISRQECTHLPATSKRGKRTCRSAYEHFPVTFESIESLEWRSEWDVFFILTAACNTTLTKMSGYITSPYYPGNSPNSFHCTWQIRLPENYIVRLKFLMFDFMDHPKCEDGFLQIRDGVNPSSPSLGRFCGYKFPKVVDSSANEMAIEFKDLSPKNNFKISYSARKSEYWTANLQALTFQCAFFLVCCSLSYFLLFRYKHTHHPSNYKCRILCIVHE